VRAVSAPLHVPALACKNQCYISQTLTYVVFTS
jgi:hypothetical protein